MEVIGVGIDAVEVDRVRKLSLKRPGLQSRVYTNEELEYASGFHDPSERLAARFAAKEATMKALGVGLWAFPLTDVSIASAKSGSPELLVRGKAAEIAAGLGVRAFKVSLSHTASDAYAVVIALGDPKGQGQ